MARHEMARIRHETRRRLATVMAVERLTPQMQRVTFTVPDLHDFVSLSADDHLKLIFPNEGSEPGARPCMRDYTPRRFDTTQGLLVLDFALHEAGPATRWALGAQAGHVLEIGGPRGSAVIPSDFDWYLFIGDETALPAIGRWVEAAAPGSSVTNVVVVATNAERQTWQTAARLRSIWPCRDVHGADAAVLCAALQAVELPPGEGFVWIAAEASVARAMRTYVVEERRHPRAWVKAAGYWSRGKANAHEAIED